VSVFKPPLTAEGRKRALHSRPPRKGAASTGSSNLLGGAQTGFSTVNAPYAASARTVNTAPAESANGRSAGFTILLIQLFIVYSRITEFIGQHLGIPSSLVLIFSILALIAVFLSGGIKPALLSPAGKLITVLTFWLMLSTPFSIWKGGSFEVLKDYWFKTYPYFIIVAGLLTTVEQVRKAIYVIAAGVMFVSTSSFVLHGRSDRLEMEGGLLGDPNSMAFFLLLALPCAVLMMSDRRKMYQIAGACTAAVLIILSVRTGSRMGILMLATILLAFWIRGSVIQKIGLAVGCFVVICLGLALSSGGSIDRYRTMLSGDSAERVDLNDPNSEAAKAIGSSEARRELMKEALHYTWEHPILGLGPGQFATATGSDKLSARWHVTHNTYLELSSEAGIPAALLYIGLIIYSTKTSLRIFRQYRRYTDMSEVTSIAYVLFVSNAAFIVAAMFGSMAYMFPYIVVVAMVVGLDRAVKNPPVDTTAAADKPLSEPALSKA